MTTLLIILIIVAAAGVAYWVWKGVKEKQRAEHDKYNAPQDPFADGDSDILRGNPRTIAAGDMIEVYGKTVAVRGSLRLREGDYTWAEHFLDTGTGVKRWLSVEADPDLEIVLWDQIPIADMEPGASSVEHEGEKFRLDESGKAKYTSEATTGLAENGTVRYHDYRGPEGKLISFEAFGEDGSWEAGLGLTLDRNQITIFHQNPDT
ncbi:DUF4178 domain-containing protein [Haloglycomyces albus]|uniref:DUF4178 domain-containing protein n=1 Tax=Haloglycomyces albus TaxID=526067 RepID=UPI00046CA69C|nr:DUF4178 domain-containing protein [Haloglycomyces albus]